MCIEIVIKRVLRSKVLQKFVHARGKREPNTRAHARGARTQNEIIKRTAAAFTENPETRAFVTTLEVFKLTFK